MDAFRVGVILLENDRRQNFPIGRDDRRTRVIARALDPEQDTWPRGRQGAHTPPRVPRPAATAALKHRGISGDRAIVH